MGIFDVFSSAPTAQPQAAPVAAPEPQALQPASTPEGLDKYANLWEAPAAQPNQGTGLNFTSDQFMEVANKMDFTQAVSPELFQKIAGGGQEGITAAMEAFNAIARSTYGQSAMASASLIDATYKKAQEDIAKQIEDKIKSSGAREEIFTKNPALNHAAAKPVVGAIQHQLQLQYPTATKAEIADMATNFLTEFLDTVSPKPQPTKSADEVDWLKYATMNQ